MLSKLNVCILELTKHELVLVNEVCHTKVHRSEYQDQRLNDTIDDCDHKDKDCERINSSIIDHWRRIQLGIVCIL